MACSVNELTFSFDLSAEDLGRNLGDVLGFTTSVKKVLSSPDTPSHNDAHYTRYITSCHATCD